MRRGRDPVGERAGATAQRGGSRGPLHGRPGGGAHRGRPNPARHRRSGPAVRRLLGRVVVTLAGLAAGCGGSRADADDVQASPHTAAAVQAGTAVATVQAFPDVVSALGTVVPPPGRVAELAAPAPTRVAPIFVTPGQRVAEGGSLIEFEG